jgi:hypothetical protein
MSDMEYKRGKLIPLNHHLQLEEAIKVAMIYAGVYEKSTLSESWEEELWEHDLPLEVINGKLYQAQIDDFDGEGLCDVEVLENGTIELMVSWYNGGGSFNEVIEGALDRLKLEED